MTDAAVRLDGATLTVDSLVAAARGARVTLAPEGLARMRASRAVIDRAVAARRPVYGVTTGLGARAGAVLNEAELAAFSVQTLRGRAQAVGAPEAAEVVRAGLAVRLNTLLSGLSGASPGVAEHIVACLNAGLTPFVGSVGSVGASDLVVNATVGLALIGEGRMLGPDGPTPAADALARAGIAPLALGPRDGLALAGHSGHSAGLAALAHAAAAAAFRAAQDAAALSLEGFQATLAPLSPAALGAKPLPGQQGAAADLIARLEGSALWAPGAGRRLQDPLSLRHVAQIHGALHLALAQAERVIAVELNGAGDNPVVQVETDEVVPTGAYYTAELGLVCETASRAILYVAMAQIARIARLLDTRHSGLPTFLVPERASASGFAPSLKTAEALVAEIAHAVQPPAIWPSVSALGVEDAFTTAPVAARALLRAAGDLTRLCALELLVGAQAVDLAGRRAALGAPMALLHDRVRAVSPPLTADRPLSSEIDRLAEAMAGR
ncbi:MAG: phenylalanine and histidine ammonia-lyase [Rhodobacteraceae bacterium]|nr:MAG: phenylalanine and histidine ammonia-lyase [Paracoccaceae bacterium]